VRSRSDDPRAAWLAASGETVGPHPALAAVAGAGRWLRWRLADGRAVLARWRQRQRYRREIARLIRSGPHLIDDIGLRRDDAERELAKPFWRP
jgi:uncharacterized protein YjiS (DUF1127 family)